MTGSAAEAKAREITQARLATLGTLVAGIAHELNTPLGALHSNHHVIERALLKLGVILEDEVVTPDELDEVRRVVRATESVLRTNRIAVERMVTLVHNLRNFGRPRTSEARPVDLHEGLEGTLVLLGHALKEIDIVRDFGDLPPVVCHPNRVNQIFMNLVHNAAQAMPDGGSLTVRTRAEGDRVHVRVADTGRGIPPEVIGEIFEPGFTTKGERIGMGLGLAIALQIVHQHGGQISVESEPGRGTTFDVYLPLRPPRHRERKEDPDATP
ncbi:sensor histidine kinase [Candidatus Palauibacter sp.]|uniref:sensor histidine kinase n=1 Tax=Candidatus Palauibacter sp. TaxID=3101350 RepID=UPI003C6F15EA